MGNGEYSTLAECIRSGNHLTSCDDDGYCNHCGDISPFYNCEVCLNPVAEFPDGLHHVTFDGDVEPNGDKDHAAVICET